jgi:hypothetical protein
MDVSLFKQLYFDDKGGKNLTLCFIKVFEVIWLLLQIRSYQYWWLGIRPDTGYEKEASFLLQNIKGSSLPSG